MPYFEDITFLDEDGNEIDPDDPESYAYNLYWNFPEQSRFVEWRDLCPNATADNDACECQDVKEPEEDLLQICRTLHHEISQLFFSRNAFVVHRCAHDGILPTLQSFRANLCFLTSLRIEINNSLISNHASQGSGFRTGTASEWHRGWQSYPYQQRDATSGKRYCRCYPNVLVSEGFFHPYKYCLCEGVDKPFSTTSRGAGRLALKELQKVVSLLNSFINPGQLDLGIICDCKDFETAKAFISAFDDLPKLRTFALRLSTHVDQQIQQLAEETVRKLTAVDEKALDLSKFAKLPAEIRTHILKFTDLVAPADIEWNPTWPYGGFKLQYHRYKRPHLCNAVSGWNMKSISYATTCTCWKFPLNLLLVNKEFHDEAMRIFYSQNHFLILPHHGRQHHSKWDSDWYYYDYKPWNSVFFTRIPPSALKYLRSVQFCLQKDPGFFQTSSVIEMTFDDELMRMVKHVPLQNLALTLDFRSLDKHIGDINLSGRSTCCRKHSLLEMCTEAVRKVGVAIRLKKATLLDFFVYLPEDVDEDIAQELEKRVMGEDYES